VLLPLQELGIVLDSPARLTQVQILSHQSKIATKIELFVGRGNDYEVLRHGIYHHFYRNYTLNVFAACHAELSLMSFRPHSKYTYLCTRNL
jgi:hypothetical protein